MSKFAISRVKWSPDRSKIVAVLIHQFMQSKLDGIFYSYNFDTGVEADVPTIIAMMANGDNFEIVNYVVNNLGLKGDQVRVKDNFKDLESFNVMGGTNQLQKLPVIEKVAV